MPALSRIVFLSALPVPLMSPVPVRYMCSTLSGEREVNAGGDEIGALARLLDHLVAGAVHVIVIVTGSAQHDVVAGAAVEIVAIEAAIQAIGAGEPVQPVDAGERR